MLKIGSSLGGIYTVLHDIGRGGTSHVYLVLNSRAGKQWAAKEVPKDSGGEKGVIRHNLITDVEILKSLRHPHIPGIADVIETDNCWYILMDYIEGVTLKEILSTKGIQSQEDVVKWAIQICDVFRYLHSQDPKIIYRDTKPSNIMLKPDGDVVLIDFGSAREYKPLSTEDTTNLGTRGYAAPEQYGGLGQSDERTDIYNLGATMYHLLTGHDPSQYPYDMYPIRKWDKSLSTGLEKIVLKCTRANPEERYQSATELMYALEHYRELDEEYEHQVKKKKITGWVTGAMAVVFLCAGIFARVSAHNLEASSYTGIIRSAQYASTKEKQVELYADAINLRPDIPQAYAELMDRVFLSDGNFSKEEADAMTEILGASGGGRRQTNEDIFSKSEGYGQFAYDLGLSYFYYYQGTGNKPMSEPWLITASEDESLQDGQRERARILSKIAGYYSRLGMKNLAGDTEMSYKEYWTDMSEITNGNIAETDNAKTAYVTYQDMTYQIRMHAKDFKKAGVKEADILAKLEDIEAHMANDFSAQDAADYKEMSDSITENIAEARNAVRIAFHGKEG